MRDAFAVLFFVSVGMLLDPGALMASPGLVLGALAIVLIAKPLVALLFVWVMKYPFRAALTSGIALAQIGEFSFILVGLGAALGLLPPEGQSLVLAGALISIAVNPLLFNIGLHTAHHEHPRAHWSQLPALHGQLRDRLDDLMVLVGAATGGGGCIVQKADQTGER